MKDKDIISSDVRQVRIRTLRMRDLSLSQFAVKLCLRHRLHKEGGGWRFTNFERRQSNKGNFHFIEIPIQAMKVYSPS